MITDTAQILRLACISGAAGGAARIQARPGGPAVTPNFSLVLGCRDFQAVHSLVEGVLAPLRQIQAERIQQCSAVAQDADKRLQQVLAELALRQAAPFPDSRHIAALAAEVFRLRRQINVRLIAQDLQTGNLADCVQQSFDNALLHLVIDQSCVDKLLNLAAGPRADLDLIRCAWSTQPHFPGSSFSKVPISLPCLSTVMVTDEPRLRRLLRQSLSPRGSGLNCLWTVMNDSPPSSDISGRTQWPGLVRRLFNMRASADPRIYQLEPTARAALEQGLDQYSSLCKTSWDQENAERRVLRIVLPIQLLGSPDCLLVPKSVVVEALEIYRSLLCERQRLLERARQEVVQVTPERLEDMLQKIRRHQPISIYRLRRLYNSERRASITPLIKQLLAYGFVSQDNKGRLFVTDAPPPMVTVVSPGKVLYEQVA